MNQLKHIAVLPPPTARFAQLALAATVNMIDLKGAWIGKATMSTLVPQETEDLLSALAGDAAIPFIDPIISHVPNIHTITDWR